MARWSGASDSDFSAQPESWTGYLVRPDRLTFWRSDAEGPSHRVEYREEPGGGWSTHHLPG